MDTGGCQNSAERRREVTQASVEAVASRGCRLYRPGLTFHAPLCTWGAHYLGLRGGVLFTVCPFIKHKYPHSRDAHSLQSSLETMSETDVPLGFNRMNRFRQSLPLSRSASQTKLRSPGVLFLQFGDETRRVHITHELSSLDTLHALIAHMFPQKLTMGMLKSPNTAILIKDEARNVFYELEDVRDIQDRSIIKIYRKEPIYASYPTAHLANGDLRREMVYSSRDSSPTRRLNSLPSSASPPSGSPSRSRLSYGGGRPPSYAGPAHPGQPALPHPHPHPHHPQGGGPSGLSPSPSAILERRDVKPDEEVSGKNMVLLKNEGLYADPYGLVHEGRLSIASTQSLAAIGGDPFAFPVSSGLYRRGSVRSLSTYSAAALQGELEEALYKPGGPLYSDSYSRSHCCFCRICRRDLTERGAWFRPLARIACPVCPVMLVQDASSLPRTSADRHILTSKHSSHENVFYKKT
ncbi:hypothetical protein JZ751_013226 [Albula glossodonta]|uniref:Actin interacting protein 3-like C-terminal domain-containing protein n=1 Tax=Albula glossodonta TaxID=121402 RepID=A0A8T2NU13_9TELE|nr:hypothetical protein JZ751_013226 [Albula glossodonta]